MSELQILIFLHVLGATIWTGGHLVLALSVLPGALKNHDLAAIEGFESRFERVGIPALLVQILTGLRLATFVASPSDWFSFSGPGKTVGFKFVLLGLTVALALHARLKIIPNLTPEKIPTLAWHIIPVTLISVLFVFLGVSFRFGGI